MFYDFWNYIPVLNPFLVGHFIKELAEAALSPYKNLARLKLKSYKNSHGYAGGGIFPPTIPFFP